MTKVISALIMLLTLSPIYALNEIKLENLKGSLNTFESGTDTMSYLDYEHFSYEGLPLSVHSDQSSINTSFVDGNFKASHNDILLNYDFGPQSFLAGIRNIITDNLNLHYKRGELLSFNTQGIEVQHSGGNQYLPELSLKCKNDGKSLINEVSQTCLSLAELDIPALNFDSLSAMSMAKSFNQLSRKMKSIDSVENLKLLIFDEAFQLQFKVKYLLNWTVRSSGTIRYDEETKLISIYLAKAKVGIISLKGKILDQIRDARLESVDVQGNMIYIQL